MWKILSYDFLDIDAEGTDRRSRKTSLQPQSNLLRPVLGLILHSLDSVMFLAITKDVIGRAEIMGLNLWPKNSQADTLVKHLLHLFCCQQYLCRQHRCQENHSKWRIQTSTIQKILKIRSLTCTMVSNRPTAAYFTNEHKSKWNSNIIL